MDKNTGTIEAATVEQADGVMEIVGSEDKQQEDKETSVINNEVKGNLENKSKEESLEEDGTDKQCITETKDMENEGKKDFQTITEIKGVKVITHVHMQEDSAEVDNVNLNQSKEVIEVTATDDVSKGGKVIVDIANHVYNDITQDDIIIEESADVDEVTEKERNIEDSSQAVVNKNELKFVQENAPNIDVDNPRKIPLEGYNEECSAKKEKTEVDATVNLIIEQEKESEIMKDLNDTKNDIVEEKDINANVIEIKEDHDCLKSNINILEGNQNLTDKEIDTIFLTEQIEEIICDNAPMEKLEPVDKELTVLTPSSLSSESKKTKQSDMPIESIDKTEVIIQELNENIETVNIDIVEKNKTIIVESLSEKISDNVEAFNKPIPKVEIPSPKKVKEISKKEGMKAVNTLDQPKDVPTRRNQTKDNLKKDEGLIIEPQIPKLVKVQVQEKLEKEDNMDSASRITSLFIPDWQPPKQNIFKYLCGCFLKPSGPN